MRVLAITLGTLVLGSLAACSPEAGRTATASGEDTAGSAGTSAPDPDEDGDDGDDGTGGDSPADGDTGTPSGETIRTDLVGHPVDGAPHFRPVANFNDDEAVTLAVDATRLGVTSETCDAYVVAAKTVDEWDEDPTLSDVRGTPTEVVLGDSLADSRIELAAPGSLSSDAQGGLGVAYDVVLDCDRDGELGGGDVIDGGERPGLYRTHDATQAGPHEIAMVESPAGGFMGQRIFYPTAIAELSPAPLVVVTHGWSYTYEDYDFLGEHLASYGYVVMHHEADVSDGGPGATHTAASNTLDNTHALLDNLGSLGGGVLDGHVDATRIMLTGHSTGGEAVVRALTQLREGTFSSPHFGHDDIRIVSSMAPVSWHPRSVIDPGDTPYHMFVAGADDDVSGAPIDSYTQSRSIYERARGDRQLTTIHGAGHGDLVSGGPAFVDQGAPALIGRDATTGAVRSVFLALAELYLRDNQAAEEFLSRPYADYHAPGIDPQVVVTREFRRASGAVVLDDFESSPGGDADPVARSSAGTAVDVLLANAEEVLMRDNDGSFVWTGDQPSNGMTHARHEGDDPHALVFDFAAGETGHIDVAVPDDAQDLSDVAFVSLRACQGTRHPNTDALGGPLSFTLSLRDGAGVTASVRIDGARAVPPPYARTGEGPGAGWGNEFVTIRVAPTEFLGDAPELDLTSVEAVRLDFGEGFGSAQGRVGLDDLQLVHVR